MRYPNASTEPLEIIRLNECEAVPGLATSRFQALWNEIERLRSDKECLATGWESELTPQSDAKGQETVGTK